MAYNRGNDLKNNINKFSRILFCMKILKFVFFVYAFVSFMFWFLNCFELDWLYLFNWLFLFPYKIVSIFYKPTGLSADFSLAIIGIISVLFGLACELFSGNLYQKISDLQEELEKYEEQKKRVNPRRTKPIPGGTPPLGIPGAQDVTIDENAVLIFIIHPHIHKIKNKPTDTDLTFQDVEDWRQRVNKQILDNIKSSLPQQKGYYRKNLFLVYKDFNYIDDFICYIRPTIDSIVAEFKKYDIDVQFNYVLSSILQISTLEKELDLMDTILSLNFINTFILTDKFKNTYERKAVKKYTMDLKGEYNLSKNLSISNIQPLFIFKEIPAQGVQK